MPTPIRPTSASCPPGTFSLTTVAVTGSRSVRPSRSTVTSKVWPARFWIACISSSGVKTGWSPPALESRPARGRAFGDTTDHGRPHRTGHRREHEHEDDGGQHEVHARAREDDEEARPQRLEREGLAGIVGQRAPAPFERILLAHHLHVAAHRNDRQAVLGFFAPPAKEHGTEADGEALDAHADPASDQEVAKLVDENEDANDDDERHDGGHSDFLPARAATARSTRRRVSASMATQASMDSSSPAGTSTSASSMSSGMSVNAMRRSRKAATAISLAALSTTGAAPPCSRA